MDAVVSALVYPRPSISPDGKRIALAMVRMEDEEININWDRPAMGQVAFVDIETGETES